MYKKISIITVSLMLVGVWISWSQVVLAQTGQGQLSENSVNTRDAVRSESSLGEKLRARREQLRVAARDRAKDRARITRCETKQTAIKTKYLILQDRISRIEEQVQHRLDRAQAFVSGNNLVIPNSEALLSDIATKRQVVSEATRSIRDMAAEFSCADDNAQEQAQLIRATVQDYQAAVKVYRQAVANYVRAVVGAFGQQNSSLNGNGR